MTISFVQPETFDPGEFLTSPSLRRRLDDARYFVSLILTKLARHDVDDRGLVRLMAMHLASIMDRATYAAVIDSLRRGRAIERFPYAVGLRSFGYRLGSRFVADKHVRVPATDTRLIRRLEKFHDQAALERDVRMKPVHRELARRQTRLEIHGNNARRILETLPRECNPFDVQGLQISNIEYGEFHCNVGRYGRVSNNITSFKRELRPTLHVDGEALSRVDVSCAQPAFLAKRMQQEGHKIGNQTRRGTKQGKYDYDLRRYVSLVQAGEFYDFMVDQLREHGIDRDEFKRKFLADVIAKKGRYPSVVEDKFRKLFPTVWQFVRWVNRSDHASLIRLLQREESEFVIETVGSDFVSRNPRAFVIPLHDALYTTRRHLLALEQSFHRGFEMTGFRMKLKVDTWFV